MKRSSENQSAKVNNASRNGWRLWVGLFCIVLGLGLLSLQVIWKWGDDTQANLEVLLPVIEIFLIGAGIWFSVKYWYIKEMDTAIERLQSSGSGERSIDVEACSPKGLEPTANLVRTDMIIDVIAVALIMVALIITSTINLQTRNEVHRGIRSVLQEYSPPESETLYVKSDAEPLEASAQIDTSLNAIIIHRPIPPVLDICNEYDDKVGGVIPKEYWSAIIIAILGLVVGLLGLKRIEGFDKEIRESNKEIREQLTRELHSSVGMMLKSQLKEESDSKSSFDKLVENLEKAEKRWGEIEKSIDSLAEFSELIDKQYADAQGAYQKVADVAEKKGVATEEERKTALVYISKIIGLGEQGKVNPSLLYNSAGHASTLGFDHEALMLAALCAWSYPQASYIVRKSRHEAKFGMRFELINSKLVKSNINPETVRKEAWETVSKLVQENPTYECELIYSEFENIARSNMHLGYIDEGIKAIEDLIKKTEDRIPSYAYATLSDFYAMRGNPDWKDDYLRIVTKAVETLVNESPASTWYQHSINDIKRWSNRVNMQEDVTQIFKKNGFGSGEGSSDEPDDISDSVNE